MEYYILGGGFRFDEWDWGVQRGGFPDTARSLKDAFDKNPFMKLFIGSGYFDLATPYFATQYTLNHMNLDQAQHAKVSLGYYGAGHMMYIQDSSLGELKKDVGTFMAERVEVGLPQRTRRITKKCHTLGAGSGLMRLSHCWQTPRFTFVFLRVLCG